MKKILLTILLLLLLPFGKAGMGYAQTWVTIPDANFAAYLQSIIPGSMNGNQMDTSSALVTTSTHSININSQNIANLSGIQYFTSLTYLNCNGNSLNTLPALPNSLVILMCMSNSLNTLPVLPNSLEGLYCTSNSLTSLPILPDSLRTLWCAYNSIFCFPTFPNSITNIDINFNLYNCLPNYVLPVMSSYTTTPLCAAGNTNGCTFETDIEHLAVNNEQINIYPNPSSGIFVIETNVESKQNVQVFYVNGKLVLAQVIQPTPNPSKEGNSITIDASSLQEGVYNVSITSSEGVVNKRIVIVK